MGNGFQQGQHICVMYDSPEEQISTAAEYLADGLLKGERVLYAAESRDALARFDAALRLRGIDTEAEFMRGALLERVHTEAHIYEGRFDSERMLYFLSAEIESALSGGFAGLRTCGDMSWLLNSPPGANQVVEYEVFLTQFFDRNLACGMCQYDRRRIQAMYLDAAERSHPLIVKDGSLKTNDAYRRV